MRNLFIWAIAGAMLMVGCTKDDGGDTDVDYPDDVALMITDNYFKRYCIDKFDTNKNGKISKSEALKATEIWLKGYYTVYNLDGIEYFTNLKKLYCEGQAVEIVDLSYNKRLADINFCNASRLKTIKLNDNITSIPENAFMHCKNLVNITIPDSVTSIEDGAFYNCSSLTSITIPNHVSKIESNAFVGCYNLTSITIPASVIEIGYLAFLECTRLSKIYCKPITPPTLGDNVFNNIAYPATIYVPKGSVNTYKTYYRWDKYASMIVGYDF